jgi:hypothetical protein
MRVRRKLARNEVQQCFNIPEKPSPLFDLTSKLAGEQKVLSLAHAKTEYGIPDLPKLLRRYLEAEWGVQLADAACGIDFENRVKIKIYNSVAYSYRPFQKPYEVAKQLLRCTPKWRKLKNGLTHNIWVRCSEVRSEDTFQGRKVCRPLLYLEYTPPVEILKLPAAEGQIDTYSKSTRTQVPSPIGLAVIVGYKYVRPDGIPNKSHGCVEVELSKQDRFVASIGSIEGAVQLIPEKDSPNNKVYLVNNYIDLETYYYVY